MDPRIVARVREDGISAHTKDVFLSCYDQIITRKITSVSELMEYVGDLDWSASLEKVIRKCFRLIRELHWGIFRDLEKEKLPRLWKALVIPDRRLRDIGDLKRNIMVPHTYCALMDIHAYTDFCQRHRHNFSMLTMLDEVIQKNIRDIARKHGCLSCRAAGDNILVFGSAATDVLQTCLGIVDCFSRRRVIKSARLSETRKGDSIVLQDINVTAGIAGGLNYSSLIVTADGDVSGSIVNTAARLQSFANVLSPRRSKVMVTAHVYAGFLRENRTTPRDEMPVFSFFNCGKVGFKGVRLNVFEVLYTEQDMKKSTYEREYRRLLQTKENGPWKERLIPDAIRLVISVMNVTPVPRIEILQDEDKKLYTTSTIISYCEHAMVSYDVEKDHHRMNKRLQKLLAIVESIPGFDRLVLIHFRQVVSLFEKLTAEFDAMQYEKVIENQNALFTLDEKRVLDNASRLERVRKRLIERGKVANPVYSPVMLWNKVIADHEKNWVFELYSGKE